MLASKQIAFGKAAEGGWQNPYITDGLAAMWDGEWNAGGGVHDANATVWTDLVGDNDLQMDAYVVVTENAMTNDVTRTSPAFVTELDTALSNALTNELDEFTIEICEDATNDLGADDYYVWECPWIELKNGRSISSANGYFLQGGYSRALGTGLFANRSIGSLFDKHSISLVANKTNGTLAIYKNGTLLSDGALGTYGADCAPLRFGITNTMHNIRIYSRALIAEEVAHNYAIDQARFNLP